MSVACRCGGKLVQRETYAQCPDCGLVLGGTILSAADVEDRLRPLPPVRSVSQVMARREVAPVAADPVCACGGTEPPGYDWIRAKGRCGACRRRRSRQRKEARNDELRQARSEARAKRRGA